MLRVVRPLAVVPADRQARRAYSTAAESSSPRKSNTPYFLGAGALAFLAGYQLLQNDSPPKINAVTNIERAMAPKTQGANVPGKTPLDGYEQRAPNDTEAK